MSSEIALALQQLSRELADSLSPQARDLLESAAALTPREHGGRGFEDLGAPVVTALQAAADHPERNIIARALIAGKAGDVVSRIAARRVTPGIMERTIDWQGRLLSMLIADESEAYAFPDDHFVKDYRFVTAITVPCGARVIDLDDGIGPKTALLLARQSIRAAISAYRSRWFRVHTETRYLDEFNAEGWANCYRELAGLLRLHPEIRGVAATSWLYDPQLVTVSPRLTYMRDLLVNNGAHWIAHGTSAFDIRMATAASSTRRALYEAGEYRPVCHSLIWHREALIQWAGQQH